MYLQWCKVDYTTTDYHHHTPHNPEKDAASTGSSSESNSNSNSCLTDTKDRSNTCTNSASTDTIPTDKPPTTDSSGQSTHIQYDIKTIDVDMALSPACETIWYGNIGR